MAKVGFFKRIVKEDFPAQSQELVDKLAYPLNSAMESIASALNKGLDFDNNFNAQVKEITITVDASGIPTPKASFKSDLKTLCRGIIIIRAENVTNPGTYPTGQPFISFSESAGQISILHVTGLQADQKYKFRLIALG